MLITIIIPAYNEENSLRPLLNRLKNETETLKEFSFEYILVNNGSTDDTEKIINEFDWIRKYKISNNIGKGDAVRLGIENSRGEYVIIQDADCEYDPADIKKILAQINHSKSIVIGTRLPYPKTIIDRLNPLFGKPKGKDYLTHLANRILSLIYFLLFFKYINDSLSGYKMMPGHLLRDIKIQTYGFETDHELLVKLFKLNCKIFEVEICYIPRTKAEGKKIRLRDFFVAIYTVIRFRFAKVKKLKIY